jgi:hypothetical protein
VHPLVLPQLAAATPPRVAFCFMIGHKLVHAEVWGNFRKGYAASLPCVVHAYDCDANAYDFPFANAERIPTQPTAWSAVGLVVVEYYLYKKAFEDARVAACCLLSESCVPLVTAPVLIDSALRVGRHLLRAGAARLDGRVKGYQFKILSREGFERLQAWRGDVSFKDKVLDIVRSPLYVPIRMLSAGRHAGVDFPRNSRIMPTEIGLETPVETAVEGVAPDEDIIPSAVLADARGGAIHLLPTALWVHPNQPFIDGTRARVKSRADAERRGILWTPAVAAGNDEHPYTVSCVERVAALETSALAGGKFLWGRKFTEDAARALWGRVVVARLAWAARDARLRRRAGGVRNES